MLGFAPGVDWLRFTWNERLIKGAGPYKQHGLVWQNMLDWAITTYPRVYHQLPRGSDKTEMRAWWTLVWGLSATGGQGFAFGVDRDNAKLFRDAAKWIVENHAVFQDYKVYNYDITNKKTGAHIRVLASDEESNYGLTPDLVLINDFHAWKNKELWEVIYSAMGKRLDARVWIESNALERGSAAYGWVKPIREYVDKESKQPGTKWHYWCPHTFLAPWQQHMLEEWSSTLSPSAFRRLILNYDTDSEEAFITEDEYNPCVVLKEPREPRKDANVCVSLDLGVKHDSAVVSVISEYTEKDGNGRDATAFELHHLDVFAAEPDKPVDIKEVVRLSDHYQTKYGARKRCDPWEMRYVIQEDETWEPFVFSGASVKEITSLMRGVFRQKRIKLYMNAGEAKQGKDKQYWNLKREIVEAIIKQMPYGERVDHRVEGYTDRIMSIGMGLVTLAEDFYPLQEKKAEPWVHKDYIDSNDVLEKICPSRQKQAITV